MSVCRSLRFTCPDNIMLLRLLIQSIITHAVDFAGYDFVPPFVCVSVFFAHAARITTLDTKICNYESWKPIYFEVSRSKVKVTGQKTLPAWLFALL